MATGSVSSTGIASGLDVNGIISKLMQIEQKPLTAMATKEAAYNAKLTAYGSLKGALSSLQTASQALATTSTLTGKSASVSDTTVLSASASSTAAAGSYSLSVTQLATSHTVRSNTNYGTADTFNTGSLAITVGSGSAVNVTIDSSNNTLAGISQAINNANAGVTATVINVGTTNRLVLSSNTSGSAGTISVAATEDGIGGPYTNTLTGLKSVNLVQTQAASDAQLTINGLAITRSSNIITDAISGVTLTLAKGTLASPGNAVLTVAKDTAATTTAINSFVTAYNTAVGLLKTSSAYNAATKTGAVLSGDSTVRSLQAELSNLVHTSVTGVAGGISTLSDIGVNVQKDGTLAVDSTKLAATLADPTKDVASLFSQTTVGNEGIAVFFNVAMKSEVGYAGLIATRTSGIGASIKDIGTARDALNARLTKVEARYRAQFTALDVVVTNMNKTSQYLTQMIASLPSSSSK